MNATPSTGGAGRTLSLLAGLLLLPALPQPHLTTRHGPHRDDLAPQPQRPETEQWRRCKG